MSKYDLDPHTAAALNRLLDEVLDLAPGERAAWLARLPDEYAVLKPRLQDLLARAAGVETSDFLGTLPKFATPPEAERPADDLLQHGRIVGTYRLIREIGKGGMGAVWLAERVDGLLSRNVALKLPRASWLHEGFVERIERERDILASLEHPNIARLYDAGIAANGRPFLALEFIEGQPIDHYCRGLHGRPAQVLRDRLRLFLQAARALAYAHGKLVLHRDLKPANILVAGDGSVRLLDFGIAKLLTAGRTNETMLTQHAGRALSPEYASPEQILGEPLTVASDVYSLGVVLYELLAGTRPYRLARATRGALEDAILHAEPERPSSVAEAPFRSLLRGDLDTLVLHALRKTPSERYPTVHALIDDIERFLDGRPVQVRSDTFAYRAEKFVRRHKLAVAAAGSVTLAILAGSGAAIWEAHVARLHEQRALAVKNFITSIFRGASPDATGGNPITAVQLLKEAEPRIAQIPRDESEVRVELETIVGDSLLDMEDVESAARILTTAVNEGTQALGPLNASVLHARVRLAEAHAYLGQYERARMELASTMQEMEGAGLQGTAEYAGAQLQRAASEIDAGHYTEAERLALRAAATARRTLGATSQPLDDALQVLSIVYKNENRADLSARYAKQAYEMSLRLHGGNAAHPNVIDAQMGYAEALQSAGDLSGAQTQMLTTVSRAEQVFGADGMMVGFFLRPLAEVERDLGELGDSLRHGQRSLDIVMKQAAPPAVAHANRLMTLGRTQLEARRVDAAASSLAQALEIRRTLSDSGRKWSVQAASASAERMAGHFVAAEHLLSEIPLDSDRLSEADRVRVLRELGVLRAHEGHHAEALEYFDRALAMKNDHAPGTVQEPIEVALERAETLSEAGAERLAAGDRDGAAVSLESALRIFTDRQRAVTPARADALERLAQVRLAQGRFGEARQLLHEADTFWQRFDPASRWAAETTRLLAKVK